MVGIGDAGKLQVPSWRPFVQINQSLGVLERQGPQEQAVENTENHGVSGDSKRRHPQNHEGVCQLFEKHAEGESQIV